MQKPNKYTNELKHIHKTETDLLMVTKGEELGGRINGEFGIDTYTILHLSGGSVTTKKGGIGWEGGQVGGDICIPMADSCGFTAETNTKL